MRLIDADALIPKLKCICEGENQIYRRESWGFAIQCLNAVEDAPTINPQPHWIPCSERLPKQGQEVICQCRASIIKVLKLDANGDWYQDANHCYMGGFVIAWMPLPSPYREEADE